MSRRIFILSTLFVAFLMLQVHNMMPHYHVKNSTENHSHEHEAHHHDHNNESDHSLPLSKTDHSAEFGNALIKSGVSKYLIAQPKFTPLIHLLYVDQREPLYHNITPDISLKLQDHIIPPAPYLQGISFRGPPLFV